MAAGAATLAIAERDHVRETLAERGAELERALAPALAALPFPAALVRVGSIFWLSLQEGPPPRSAARITPAAATRYAALFHVLLDEGVALAPSAYEVGFLSAAHGTPEIERFAAALARAGKRLAAAGAPA
jgi:glutamate-1-semialdehyde 2,1-aminomutase